MLVPSMPVPVMQVRVMPMAMSERLVAVQV
jgi:hypothetical protein